MEAMPGDPGLPRNRHLRDAVMPKQPDVQVMDVIEPPPGFHDQKMPRSEIMHSFATKAELADIRVELRLLQEQFNALGLGLGREGDGFDNDDVDRNGHCSSNLSEPVKTAAAPVHIEEETDPAAKVAVAPEPVGKVNGWGETVSLSESIWEVSMFIGMPSIGAVASVLLALQLLVNILIQTVFIFIIRENLAQKAFTKEDLDGLSAFRHKIAHDARFVSQASSVSLADRVCRQDLTLEMATTQVTKLTEIKAYLGEEEKLTKYLNGPVMCQLALVVWIMCIFKEVSACFTLFSALRLLPSTRGGRPSVVSSSPTGSFEIKHLAPCRKAFALSICLMRLTVAGVLLWIGTQYLCYTTSIGDLLLNAMALEVVINVDELVFGATAPVSACELVANLAPLPLRPARRWRGADLPALLMPLILVGLMVLCGVTSLADTVENLKEAERRLCGDRLDFVYKFDGLGMVQVTSVADFDIHTAYDTTDTASLAVREVKDRLEPSQWRYALLSLSTESKFMDQASQLAMTSTVRDIYLNRQGLDPAVLDCHDAFDRVDRLMGTELFLTNQWNVWPQYLRTALNLPVPVVNCDQVRDHCFYNDQQSHLAMAMIRALCPVTCGCNSLLFGTIFTANAMGCPQVCLNTVDQTERDLTECADTDPRSEDPRVSRALAFFEEIKLAHPNRSTLHIDKAAFEDFGCLLTESDIDLCVASGSNLLTQLTPVGATPVEFSKILTMMCPKTCNCDGKRRGYSKRPPEAACPSRCICPWRMEPEISPWEWENACTADNPFYQVWPELPYFSINVSVDSQCCHLIRTYLRVILPILTISRLENSDVNHSRLNKSDREALGQTGSHLCRSCRTACVSTLHVLVQSASQGVQNLSAFRSELCQS